ncbi:MAG: M48 family metalloprotease [Rhodospirillales bacterium]|nr:M48 family metalloprotease [Rhodospirillales bacterium]
MNASMNRISVKAAVYLVAAVLAAGAVPAHAQNQKISFIRDAEIENTIREFAIPVFHAAGLDPTAVSIYLVQDGSINAFVAGGQRLFLNTGLLTRTTNAGQVIGVIAHETGHIAGGHLARIQDALQNSTATTILAMLLGGAAIGAGRGDIGSAIVSAGQSVGLRSLLQYSRTQESAADQAGLKFLESAGISAKGLLEFMNILGDQELLRPEQQDPYVLTHPLPRDRIIAIQDYVSRSPIADKPVSNEFAAMHARMKAKLYAFLNPLTRTLKLYKESDNSLESRYARAIAYFRKPDMAKAIPLINGLIAEHPDDPYFWELKGQMYFETGDAKSALGPYQKAVQLLPNSELIRTDLARIQLALNDPEMLDAAIKNLRYAIGRERDVPFRWHQLAIAYGRKGDKGHSSLALAEEALLLGRKPVARYHAGLAAQTFPKGSREWLQAEDILIAAKEEKKP